MKCIPLAVFILTMQLGFCQHKGELQFVEHLVNKGYYQEVIRLTDKSSFIQEQGRQDSLNYYRGWAFYSLKNL